MGQNALGQLDYRIFKSTISLEKTDEKAWFIACWYRFRKMKSWLKNIGVSLVKNGCGHPGLRTLKLALSQEEINSINWFLVWWHRFRKGESYFNNFWVVVVKNGCDLQGYGILKSAVSQKRIDELRLFFSCRYKFSKLSRAGMVKNGRGLIDHGFTLKLGVSHKLIERFLHADSDGIMFGWRPI